MSASHREETHFGYSKVPLEEKQGLVDGVFHRVADRYDLMNDLMSFGLHRVWKDILVAKLHPPRRSAFLHLDVAGGTGDVAFRVAEAGGPLTSVTALDVNPDMLRVGRERAARRKIDGRVTFVEGNAEALAAAQRPFRRLYDRIRHSQRAAHRQGIDRGLPGAQTRRAFSCPGVFARRHPCSRPALRRLFLHRHSSDRQGRRRRWRALSLSR